MRACARLGERQGAAWLGRLGRATCRGFAASGIREYTGVAGSPRQGLGQVSPRELVCWLAPTLAASQALLWCAGPPRASKTNNQLYKPKKNNQPYKPSDAIKGDG